MQNQTKPESLPPSEEELESEAVASALIEHELDPFNPSEQSARAILQLFRALAIGKTIAVVGSGASVIYGYPEWSAMVENICNELIDGEYNSKPDAIKKFEQLKKILKDNRENEKKKNESKRRKKISSAIPPEQNQHLNKDEKLTLCDEAANCLDQKSKEKLDLILSNLFERPHRYYTLDHAIKNHPLRIELIALISELPIRDSKARTGRFEDTLLPADLSSLIFDLPIKEFDTPNNSGNHGLINAPRNLLDPLSELRSRLGIHRFVTFNYDLEIEALLEDIDYPFDELTKIRKPVTRMDEHDLRGADRVTESRLGGTAHSVSLSPQNAPDLITIAAIPSSANDLIVHVHGAITRPSDMVVTQSKYNAIYYDEHDYRRGFDDARHLLFGGNHVLYIGLGLTEEDLMRPLRYLSANLRNRPIFALMPLLSNENRAKAFEHKIKSNYGVNVITFGRAESDLLHDVWEKNQEVGTHHPRHSNGKEFISLGQELRNIRELFRLSGDDNLDLSRIVSSLKCIKRRKCLFPRLHDTRTNIVSFSELILKREKYISIDKIENFVKRLQKIAITVALCDALEYIQGVAITWQNRLKISDAPSPKGQAINTGHYGAVYRAEDPECCISIDTSSEKYELENHLKLREITPGTRVFWIEKGRGRGSLFNQIKEECQRKNREEGKAEWLAINISHSVREKTILSEIIINLDKIRVLCLHDADSLLDDRETQPATLFLDSFLHQLKIATEIRKNDQSLHLMLIVRTARAATFFSRMFARTPYGPLKPIPIAIHDADRISETLQGPWHKFMAAYPYLANTMLKSRWAFLSVLGAMKNLHESLGEPIFTGDSQKDENKKSFLGNCNLALKNRLFSVDQKHHHAALCEVILEERHRLIQRSMDISLRSQVIVENIILKWMYAIPIAIDQATIFRIPELTRILKNKNPDNGNLHNIEKTVIPKALKSLKAYRFIFEIDYDNSPTQDTEKSRYILHGAIHQLLGYRRGFSLDAPAAKDHNSVSLSLMLMDGGPMLGPLDFASTCELYEKLIKLSPDPDNRVAIRSAYALIRSTIHTQSAMRIDQEGMPIDYRKSALHSHLRRLAKLRSLAARSPRDKYPPLLYQECELWLLNEIGVVRYLQGNLHDAVFSFRECMEASNRITIGASKTSMAGADPSLLPRLSINLALCLIDRARFHDAESLVDKALRALPEKSKEHENPECRLLWALLQGCRAQIYLLTAQLDSARQTVDDALPIIEKLRALGAQAWLHSVQAAAELASEEHSKADKAISLALAAARGAHRPDLILHLELNAIDIQLTSEGYNREVVLSSLSRLENLERAALRLGSHRSKCSAMLIRARALLTLEQMEPAREAIIEAISIAQLNGMRLKRISGLTLLVALMAQRGEREPAKKLLRSVKLAANRARYVRAVADIERLQQAMEIEGGVPYWAGFVSDFGSTDRRTPRLR